MFKRKRKTRTVELEGGACVVLTSMGPRTGYRLKDPLIEALGPLFVTMIDDVEDREGNKIPIQAVLGNEEYMGAFMRQFVAHVQETDTERLLHIAADVVNGCAMFHGPTQEAGEDGVSPEPVQVALEGETTEDVLDLFDQVFSDWYEMSAFCIEALRFNFRPSSLVKAIFASLMSAKSGRRKTPT